VVEEGDHQPRAGLEAAEDGALADPRGRRHVLHRHGVDAVLLDQAMGGGQEQLPVAGGVATLLRTAVEHRQQARLGALGILG